jgi:hypothetical protein
MPVFLRLGELGSRFAERLRFDRKILRFQGLHPVPERALVGMRLGQRGGAGAWRGQDEQNAGKRRALAAPEQAESRQAERQG